MSLADEETDDEKAVFVAESITAGVGVGFAVMGN